MEIWADENKIILNNENASIKDFKIELFNISKVIFQGNLLVKKAMIINFRNLLISFSAL
jgi:hypothetical protein